MKIPPQPKDKRTKAYKEWKAKYDSAPKGLGDTVEKITKATGIKKAVKWLAGEDCGCDERKTKLNELFRYQKTECLTEEEFEFLDEIFSRKGNQLPGHDVDRVRLIYNRVFYANRKPTSCSPCFISNTYNPLKKLYETYK